MAHLSGRLRRFTAALIAGATSIALAGAALAAPSGQPIRIGSTLALTGPLASTSLIHKLAGEIFVEQLNQGDGLLGRPVEWVLKDDQSKPDLARTLYEQLVTVDKVDLLMGPYATGAILSAMSVAQRYNKILVHHTFGIPSLAKYDMQFPAWSLGRRRRRRSPPSSTTRSRPRRTRPRPSPSSPANSRPCISCRWAPATSPRSAGCRKCCIWNGNSATAISAPSPRA